MATGTIPLARIAGYKVFAPVQVRTTPPVTYIDKSKMFTAPTSGTVGPIPRRKTQTIDIRM